MAAVDVLARAAMPPATRSYRFGPYHVVGREYLIVKCESPPEATRGTVLPYGRIVHDYFARGE